MENKNLRESLNDLAKEMKARIIREARIDKTVATGKFISGFDVVSTKDSVMITNSTKYAKAVIEGIPPKSGARPHTNNIIDWMKRKRLRPYKRLPSGGVKFVKLTSSAYKKAAFGIKNAVEERKGTIKRFNYKGSNLIREVYEDMERKIGVELTEAYKEDLKTEIRRIIQLK